MLGGDQITFFGTGFDPLATTVVKIDGRICTIDEIMETSITCTTESKPYTPGDSTLEIFIDGKGLVAVKDFEFKYVSKWSDAQTWGFEGAPVQGDAISIPSGQNLLFDIDASPLLSFVSVEGSLIFPPNEDPNHVRTFDAGQLIVKGGLI